MYQYFIEGLQRLGRALMLPIAILPIAGLLLRLGDTDLLNIAIIHDAGQSIFGNLALIFAIGIAVGFAKDNNGTAGLAGAIGYLVMISTLKVLDASINMGMLAGIISGLMAGALYNRFKDIKLPEYLAFFGGRRFVPIATGFTAVGLGVVFGLIWPPIQHGINSFGQLLLESGSFGAFVFGVFNRLLIVTGLHHILNNMAWFIFGSFTDPSTGAVVTGDLTRYFAGDPKGGQFMTGMFPMMLFGLPAACLAMYHAAAPERRKAVGGMLFSLALTSALTGVTEPIEFSFMFLAPLLYAVHAVLTGLSMTLMDALGVKLGFGFSAGLLDYVLNFNRATRPLVLLPVGAAYFVLYYGLFRFFIARFDLKTPGREPKEAGAAPVVVAGERGAAFARALGGSANLTEVGACTTRLRLNVRDQAAVDDAALKALGARGLIRPSATALQVVLGPVADVVAVEIRDALATSGVMVAAAPAVEEIATAPVVLSAPVVKALGGMANVRDASVHPGRVRVALGHGPIDEAALRGLGVRAVARPAAGTVHLLVVDTATLTA